MRYELTGGFIKNAILLALSIAVSRDGEAPIITQDDLLTGASLQLRGKLRMKVCINVYSSSSVSCSQESWHATLWVWEEMNLPA